MLKFLRLYQGWILAVFGTMLLVVFLLPQALQGLFQASAVAGGDWATVGEGETVTYGDLQRVQGELRILELLQNQIVAGLGADADPAYWFLLSREAEQAGLVGGTGTGEDMLAAMSQQLATQGSTVTETDLLVRFMGSSGFSDRQALETLAKVQGVNQLAIRFQTAARYSDERLRQAAAELALAVDADLVIIDAKADESGDTPDEAALDAQFQAHKSEKPGEGKSGFGYKLPNRAKLEWITVNKDDVKAGIDANTNLDPIEMRKEFMRNPTAFGAATVETTKPKFTDYQDAVRESMLRDLLLKRMDEIEKFLSDQTHLPRRGIERVGVTYVLPEDWPERRANFAELASALGEEFQTGTPESSDSGELLEATEIDAIPGLGVSRSGKFGRQPTRASEYVMAAAEFSPESTIPAQAGIAGPVFKDGIGNLYMFRIIETDPAREATSVDEVRDAVTKDAKALARFKKLESERGDLESKAIEYGLQPIAETFNTTVKFVANIAKANPEFLQYGIKSPTRITGLTTPQDVVDAIVAHASQLDYTVPASDLPTADRTFLVSDEENLALVAVQITAIDPLTKESWTELASSSGMLRVLATDETAIDFTESFSFDALAARHNFKPVRTTPGDDPDETDGDGEQADATRATATTTSG
jgi:hypothetical protein